MTEQSVGLEIRSQASREFDYLNREGMSLVIALAGGETLIQRIERESLLYQMLQTALLYDDLKRASRLLLLLHKSAAQTKLLALECLSNACETASNCLDTFSK